jgi:hypothetical protein
MSVVRWKCLAIKSVAKLASLEITASKMALCSAATSRSIVRNGTDRRRYVLVRLTHAPFFFVALIRGRDRKEETPVLFHSNGHGTVHSARNVHLGRASELATGILPMGKHFFVLHPRANAAGSPPAALGVMLPWMPRISGLSFGLLFTVLRSGKASPSPVI